MIFRKIELNDWGWIANYCRSKDSRQLNYSFEVLFLWRDICDFEVAEHGGFLFIKTYLECKHNFLFPLGGGDLGEALRIMESYAEDNGCTFQLFQVTEGQKRAIEEQFPNMYNFQMSRNEFEYIFETERLTNLQGKKLQAKRNHINSFEKNNDWTFEEITDNNLFEVMMFSHQWDNSADISIGSSLTMENMALMNAIESYVCLQLQGGILRVAGKIVAFAIGCSLTSDTYLLLFEKADAFVRGSYSMINREFVRRFCQNFRYVNRAEDNGDEGLRKAKLSYYPDILLEVYTMSKK
ncbi:MAG: phosphatidylglycerol lysyltransferase domain-containing protein [Bacteroidales bacterium]